VRPSGVAFDPATRVLYVVDAARHRVLALAVDPADPALTAVLGTVGGGARELSDGRGATVAFAARRGLALVAHKDLVAS